MLLGTLGHFLISAGPTFWELMGPVMVPELHPGKPRKWLITEETFHKQLLSHSISRRIDHIEYSSGGRIDT